jgi:ferrous iron transport protein B
LLEQRRAAHPEGSAGRAAFQAQLDELELRISGEYQRQSLLGRLGHWIEPAVRPLGWDWRIGCAVIASFPAREVVVATLGVIYNQGREIDVDNPDDSSRLQSALRAATWDGTGQPVFTVPVALSIMVFFSLCAQCGATLAVIKRETNSWRWPIFTFAYMTTLAYVASFAVYQLGTRLLEAFPEGLG